MRLILLTTLTMAAFAANSVLNRLAVGEFGMDAASFALIRVAAGAVTLAVLVGLRDRRFSLRPPIVTHGMLWAVAGLTVYLAGFSFAYLRLGAGTGALLLFGAVQLTMFTGALLRGQTLGLARTMGAGIAFLGLILLVWPGAAPLAPGPTAAMIAAGFGWGIYSLAGSVTQDALVATACNFAFAAPFVTLFWLGMGAAPLAGPGLWLAVISGAITSGLGYALWYAVLPALGAQRAAVAQLTVPVIAAAGGAVLLGEQVGLRFVLASLLVLGGVAIASLAGRKAATLP